MGEELGLHFNLTEAIWTLVAALGLWITINLLLASYEKRRVVRNTGWNGARVIIAQAGVVRNRYRVMIVTLMLIMGFTRGFYPDREIPGWVSVGTVVGLIGIAVMVVVSALQDRRTDTTLLHYFEDGHALQVSETATLPLQEQAKASEEVDQEVRS